MKKFIVISVPITLCICGPVAAAAQFDEIEVPAELAKLDFMLGNWTVDGQFRTPDHVGTDRTLWYVTRGRGVTKFDGKTWTAFQRGDSPASDSIIASIAAPGEPYRFTNSMHVERIQDSFVLMIDEGRTSGTTLIHFDPATSSWISQSIHAPTNTVTTSRADSTTNLPVFEGTGSDRRGPRIFRRRFEIHSSDYFTMRTDISFDDGATWIENQIVQEVRRI